MNGSWQSDLTIMRMQTTCYLSASPPIVHITLQRLHETSIALVKLVFLSFLSAAFDTVDYKILLDILEYPFGIRRLVLKWYQYYLADRTQTFEVGLDRSIAFIIDLSVP